MSGETKEVFGSNYGQNDVIINGLIEKMTLFDDNLMSLVSVSYTHLDVYKRQTDLITGEQVTLNGGLELPPYSAYFLR